MSGFKGTKGVWEVTPYINVFCSSVRICNIGDLNREITLEDKANAKLISCAPEMLEMLEETFKLTDKLQMPTEFEISQLRDKLFHLIKKATEL